MSYAWIQSAIGTLYTSSAPDAGRTDEALYGMKVEILETDSKTNRVFVRTHYRYQGWISQDQLYPENAQTKTGKPMRRFVCSSPMRMSWLNPGSRRCLSSLLPAGPACSAFLTVERCVQASGWPGGIPEGAFSSALYPAASCPPRCRKMSFAAPSLRPQNPIWAHSTAGAARARWVSTALDSVPWPICSMGF